MKKARVFNMIIVLALTVSMLLGSQSAAAQEGGNTPAELVGDFVPGEVVVRFPNDMSAKEASAQASALSGEIGAQVVGQYKNLALLSFAEDADVAALSDTISGMGVVEYAGPNYVYKIPELAAAGERPEARTTVTRPAGMNGETYTVEVEALKAMRSKTKAATYPNDWGFWENWGYTDIGAEMVWKNKTKGKGVCILDTGVDYNHKDLKGLVTKGYDFVNDDKDPMDDHGHGTHVAGVVGAKVNNKEGIAGVSNGKVIAVKVLNAQGSGTSFNIAAGMYYCASRNDVAVLNMSLGSTVSDPYLYNATDWVVNVFGKLLVAAAGNSNTSDPHYPAYYSAYGEFNNKVISVAAEDSPYGANYGCRAPYSNYGSWVSVIAPGSDIYSTMPWDKPFYMNYYDGFNARYDYLSGTSMATPFVAGAAARRWGYAKNDSNAQVGSALKNTGPFFAVGDDACWPASMDGVAFLNSAALLDRGAAWGRAYSATTGLQMPKTKITVYQNGNKRGTGQTEYWWTAYTDILDLPVSYGDYFATVNVSGVTKGEQPAFFHDNFDTVFPGLWSWIGTAAVPDKSSNFTLVTGWEDNGEDLSMDLWLPDAPFVDPNQPAKYIVGPEGNDFGMDFGDSTGTLGAFPYAIYNRDGGIWDQYMESITLRSRSGKYPYYKGTYYWGVTDWSGDPLTDTTMNAYLWKSGVIYYAAWNQTCSTDWWFPYEIVSGPNYWYADFVDYCVSGGPYANPYSLGFDTAASTSNDGDVFVKKPGKIKK